MLRHSYAELGIVKTEKGKAFMELIKKSKNQYKANLHSHSNLSDGELPAERIKEIYKEHGYSVLAVTDHEYPYDHSALSEEDFLMLTGYEAYIRGTENCVYDIYSPEIHINLFAKDPHNTSYVNFTPAYCKYIKDEEYKNSLKKAGSSEPRKYTAEYINSFVENAKAAGYLAAHNHPVWSLEEHEMISKYRGFFSMEMCNYGAHNSSELEYNGALYDRLAREGKHIFCHGSDDNHNHSSLSSPKSDSFGAFTMILADTLTYPDIIAALEAGNFYSSMGPEILSLTVEGKTAHIETSPSKKIIMHYGSKTPRCRHAEPGSFISSADFEIPDGAKYIRFTAADEWRRYADTRAFFRDEFEKIK